MTSPPTLALNYQAEQHRLECAGEWDLAKLVELKKLFTQIVWPQQGEIIIDGQGVTKMDSAGALLLSHQARALAARGLQVSWQQFAPQQEKLLTLIADKVKQEQPLPPTSILPFWLTRFGQFIMQQWHEFTLYLHFIGRLSTEFLRIGIQPSRIRWNVLAMVVFRTGYQALPIIALLSFMIGLVLSYQMGLQLRNYGANVYIVDLLGLAILREFGCLITAIMVAGRTGSAFTAQIGMMKLNQEIDALNTMGVTPAELLLLPRIIGLTIALPLLTIWADIFGIIGGMVMANSVLNISWHDFLIRFPHSVPLKHLIIGLGKAPVFALIIASVGCFQGMQVQGSAESVGQNTTRSVVVAIFCIIIADALFSVLFSRLRI